MKRLFSSGKDEKQNTPVTTIEGLLKAIDGKRTAALEAEAELGKVAKAITETESRIETVKTAAKNLAEIRAIKLADAVDTSEVDEGLKDLNQQERDLEGTLAALYRDEREKGSRATDAQYELRHSALSALHEAKVGYEARIKGQVETVVTTWQEWVALVQGFESRLRSELPMESFYSRDMTILKLDPRVEKFTDYILDLYGALLQSRYH